MMLTVDTITGGNRERIATGFSIPFKLTLAGIMQFAIKPMWGINYLTHPKFALPQLDDFVDMSGGALDRELFHGNVGPNHELERCRRNG